MAASLAAQAVIFTGPNQVEIQKVLLPPVGQEDVLVRVDYSSISIGTER